MYRLMMATFGLALTLFLSSTYASQSLQTIVAQQRQLAAKVSEGSLGLAARERAAVEKAQAEVFALAEGKGSLSDFTIAEKTRFENALEKINATVNGELLADEEQEVCWRQRKVGSQMMVTRCGTKREVAEAREGARGFMQRARTCVASETASCGAAP
jgi:hypothetical protein